MNTTGRTYQICVRCVMDTSDPAITFSMEGVCSHCASYDAVKRNIGFIDPSRKMHALEEAVARIKHRGRGRDYDCIIGLSGGVDSSYVALKVKELGLRPLAVHLDNGWNSEIAVSNIEQLVRRLDIELVTHVLEWDEFRDLQVAFLRASTPDGEIPTDHAIVAAVFGTARRRKVPSLVLGYNIAAELVLPEAWSHGHFDWRYISAVHERFGARALRTYPHLTLPDYLLYQYWVMKRSTNILNFIDYDREQAITELEATAGWRRYGGKHYESIYTRFYQGYVLPTKFGYDKRRAHQSSMILAGLQTRERAIVALAMPPYESDDLLRQDRAFVVKKLGLMESEFDSIMRTPPRTRADFPNMLNSTGYRLARAGYRTARKLVPSFVRP